MERRLDEYMTQQAGGGQAEARELKSAPRGPRPFTVTITAKVGDVVVDEALGLLVIRRTVIATSSSEAAVKCGVHVSGDRYNELGS